MKMLREIIKRVRDETPYAVPIVSPEGRAWCFEHLGNPAFDLFGDLLWEWNEAGQWAQWERNEFRFRSEIVAVEFKMLFG